MNAAIDIWANIDPRSPLSQIFEDLHDSDRFYDWPCVDYEMINAEINTGLFSYVKVAYFLDKIRYHKLYKKKGFNSFKEYCLKALRKSSYYCNKIISAAQVCIQLAAAGFEQLPNCVAQALPLVKFNTVDGGGNSPLAEKWQKVLDETPDDKPITATAITQIVDDKPPETKPLPIKLKPETYAKLEKIAKAKGITIQEVIDSLADLLLDEIEAEPTDVEAEKIAEWEEDVKSLIAENQANCLGEETARDSSNYRVIRPGSMPDSS